MPSTISGRAGQSHRGPRRPPTLTGRPVGTAPRGTRTSLTTRTVRAGRPPRGGTRTGVTTRTMPGRGRGTRAPLATVPRRTGCRRMVMEPGRVP
jgi:hypothetical protein